VAGIDRPPAVIRTAALPTNLPIELRTEVKSITLKPFNRLGDFRKSFRRPLRAIRPRRIADDVLSHPRTSDMRNSRKNRTLRRI